MNGLRTCVLESGYLPFYLFFGDANLRFHDWDMAASALSGSGRVLLDTFLLQQPVARKRLESAVGSEVVEELLKLEILVRKGRQLQSNGFLLLSVRGQVYFCQVTENPFAYFGEDSLALATYQNPLPGAEVLDLCAGPGIQSLVAASRGASVTAVERNPKAAAVAAFNVRLNGRERRVRVVNAALEDFATKNRKRFDQILFNPPLVPVPEAMDYHPAGHGGVVGLDVIDRIFSGYRGALNPGGRFEFIGMTMRSKAEPPSKEPLQRLLSDHGLSGRLHVVSRHHLNRNSIVLNTVVNSLALSNGLDMGTAMDRTLAFYEEAGYDEFYLYYCAVGPDESSGTVQVVDMSASHFGGWFS